MKAFAILLLMLVPAVALAHGPHKWVLDGLYRSIVSNELCCGEHDCVHLARQDVRQIGGNWTFVLDGTLWTVPAGEVQWGEDGQYSVCIWGGKVKCFFVPPDGA